MRHARVKAEGSGCYHVVSRIVDRAFRLDDAEKEIFRGEGADVRGHIQPLPPANCLIA